MSRTIQSHAILKLSTNRECNGLPSKSHVCDIMSKQPIQLLLVIDLQQEVIAFHNSKF